MGCSGEGEGSCRGVRGPSVNSWWVTAVFISVASVAEIWNTNSRLFPGRTLFFKLYAKKAGEGSKENRNPRCISALENLEDVGKREIFALVFVV